MSRSLTLIALVVTTVLSLALYVLEHEVDKLQRELDGVSQALVREQEAIQVLRAEWSYLNRPERLQQLAGELQGTLGLQGMLPMQIGTLAELPLRDPADDATTPDRPATLARQSGHDPLTPGGVLLTGAGERP